MGKKPSQGTTQDLELNHHVEHLMQKTVGLYLSIKVIKIKQSSELLNQQTRVTQKYKIQHASTHAHRHTHTLTEKLGSLD